MSSTLKDTKDNVLHFLYDFKNFSLKTNAVDMALGIVIGTSFSKIISSLVSDIIMPLIGFMLGNINFVDLKLVLKQAVIDQNDKVVQSAVTINYGQFLQVLVDFIIIAFCVFLTLRIMRRVFHSRIEGQWQKHIKQ